MVNVASLLLCVEARKMWRKYRCSEDCLFRKENRRHRNMANFSLYSRHQVSWHVCSFFGSSQTEQMASLKRSDYASSRHRRVRWSDSSPCLQGRGRCRSLKWLGREIMSYEDIPYFCRRISSSGQLCFSPVSHYFAFPFFLLPLDASIKSARASIIVHSDSLSVWQKDHLKSFKTVCHFKGRFK